MRRALLLVLVISSIACGSRATPVAAPENTESILKAQTQELLDAIAVGDRAVWERYLDPEAVYLSEDGELETKASLLAQLDPLPAGITGRLVVRNFQMRQYGDTAVVFHVDDETVDYFGHRISAEYRTTATWRRTTAGWRLLATQVHASLADPPAIELPVAELDEYVGTYRLSADVTYVIHRDGPRLVGQRTGRPPQTLSVEAYDVLFLPGQPRSRRIFQRDATGRVTGFVDRREGRDVPWQRE